MFRKFDNLGARLRRGALEFIEALVLGIMKGRGVTDSEQEFVTSVCFGKYQDSGSLACVARQNVAALRVRADLGDKIAKDEMHEVRGFVTGASVPLPPLDFIRRVEPLGYVRQAEAPCPACVAT